MSCSDEFKGKCLTCSYAIPTKYKHQMECRNAKAICRGLTANGWGGGEPKAQVHKLFGCVYYEKFK